MYLTVIKDGKFTGTQYNQIKPNILKHHHDKDEKLVWIERKLERDVEGNVTEEPTEEDLENEITEATDLRQVAKEVEKIKRGAGIGQKGEKGISQRIDDLEERLEKLEG